jgi:hypothetical protein
MFYGLVRKIQFMIIPIFLILLTFIILIFFSFFHIIRDDYIKKSQQFPHQLSKNFSLQLEQIQKLTDIMIRKYNLDNISIKNNSKIGLVKSLSQFTLYNPNITKVHLLKGNDDYLYSNSTLYAPLINDFNYVPYQSCWFYSKTYGKMVYTQALSGDLTHIAVFFAIDSSRLVPKKQLLFSNFTEIYAVTENGAIYNIMQENKSRALSPAEILNISHSPVYSEYSKKSLLRSCIINSTDSANNSFKIVSVQSTDYVNNQFRQIILFLFFYLMAVVMLCIISIKMLSRWITHSLEALNQKFSTSVINIDELTSYLK